MAARQRTQGQRAGRDAVVALRRGRREMLRLGGGGALAGALLAGGMRSASAVAADPPAIVGSWYFIRAPDSNPRPDLLARWTISFLADGNIVAQALGGGQNPRGNTLSASVGNGVWAQTGDGTFGFTYVHVRYEEQTGAPFSLFKHFGDITLAPDGQTFAVTYYLNGLNMDTMAQDDRRPLNQGTGMRITLEPNRQ